MGRFRINDDGSDSLAPTNTRIVHQEVVEVTQLVEKPVFIVQQLEHKVQKPSFNVVEIKETVQKPVFEVQAATEWVTKPVYVEKTQQIDVIRPEYSEKPKLFINPLQIALAVLLFVDIVLRLVK